MFNLNKLIQKGKIPKINLTPLERTAVKTPTKEDYDLLMKVYQVGGWRFFESENLPTERDYWNKYKDKTCVEAGLTSVDGIRKIGCFGYSNEENYKKIKKSIIFPKTFYKKQKIGVKILKEINKSF